MYYPSNSLLTYLIFYESHHNSGRFWAEYSNTEISNDGSSQTSRRAHQMSRGVVQYTYRGRVLVRRHSELLRYSFVVVLAVNFPYLRQG